MGSLLDGELVVGKKRGAGVLQRTSSGVTSVEGEPDYTLWVFDRMEPGIQMDFWHRLASASLLVKEMKHPRIKFLKHEWIEDLKSLEQYLEDQLRLGYEGIFLRDPKGLYKEGKSSIIQQWALKIKPFVDSEGKVVGYFEEKENTNEAKRDGIGKLKRSSAKAGKREKGTLGGLILVDIHSGVEVRVGGGFTKEQREKLWPIKESLIGETVRYKKQQVGEKEKPRHPNFIEFVDFRPEWDG